MFDRVVITPERTRTEYVTREIHEHRAPTDKSVELLKEFEAAATKKIEDSVSVANNSFSCVVHRMRDFASDRTILKAIFTLNDKRMTTEISWHPLDGDEKAMVFKLRDAISAEITVNALSALPWNNIMRQN